MADKLRVQFHLGWLVKNVSYQYITFFIVYAYLREATAARIARLAL